MGAALQASGRDIVYSCSWPAYLGDNESTKPYNTMIQSGCNLWRNWHDIQCSWSSLVSIIDHYGDYGDVLRPFAGPGHFNDMDMLLGGNDCISIDEAKTQLAIWSIYAAPLIMGNDIRNISKEATEVLTNKYAIAVNQDPAAQQGGRVTPKGAAEIWARNLDNGDVAVALFNKNSRSENDVLSQTRLCPLWNKTTGGYRESCHTDNVGEFSNITAAQAKELCCKNAYCAGFSYDPVTGDGYLKGDIDCGFQKSAKYIGFDKPNFAPPQPAPRNITLDFYAHAKMTGSVHVFDIWAKKSLGSFSGNLTVEVAPHGSAFFRLSRAS